jgi:flagellar hook-basal body complex protein FliE
MATNIGGVSGVTPSSLLKQDGGGASEKGGAAGGPSFGELIKAGLDSAITAQRTSEQTSAASLVGKASMTDVLQATNNAEIALNTVLAIRDRVVQAWQEIMRTQI